MRYVLKLFKLGGHTVSELEQKHAGILAAQGALRELADQPAIQSLGAEVSALKNLRSLL